MTVMTKRRLALLVRVGAAGFASLLLLSGGCEEEVADECAEDLPEGWECAEQLELETLATSCEGTTILPAVVSLESVDAALNIAVSTVLARQEQEMCAYLRQASGAPVVDLLLQPCDMHPTSVNKGDCKYDFLVHLGVESGVSAVEVFQRADFVGADGDPNFKSLGTAPGV